MIAAVIMASIIALLVGIGIGVVLIVACDKVDRWCDGGDEDEEFETHLPMH